jgi:hypothetical protein
MSGSLSQFYHDRGLVLSLCVQLGYVEHLIIAHGGT